MLAAFYLKQGPAREVLQVGEHPTPEPGPGEVRVHLKTSGVNPSDWKSRSGRTAPMLAPLIIPHSDGAGDIDGVGLGVANRGGERVWVWMASPAWHGRRVHRAAVGASCAAARTRRLCRRSLFRHPRTHCPSSSPPWRTQPSLDCDGCWRHRFGTRDLEAHHRDARGPDLG